MDCLKIVRLAIGAAAIFLGGASLYLSAPVFVGDLLLIPGNRALRNIQERKPVTPKGIEVLIASRRHALEWWDSERVWTDLGLAHLISSAWVDKQHRRGELLSARDALHRGLTMAPASPYVWTRTAYVHYLLDGVSEKMTRALRMALITGPHERFIAHVRFELGLLAWNKLGHSDRILVERQAASAWGFDPARALTIARARGKTALLRRALESNPEQLRFFDRRMKEG
ncbi:MAG: hypothetical protein COA65_06905 [Rhodospirillaceae bacterium]|nr:MAG: hypothetical protein COA65_06905 [Rhodospirillaceae bacterium]